MSDQASPSPKNFWITLAAVAGAFAIFLLILWIAYLPQRQKSLTVGSKTPEERTALLAETRAKDAAAASSYGWIDQQAGTVRLPIERAMELTLQELNAAK